MLKNVADFIARFFEVPNFEEDYLAGSVDRADFSAREKKIRHNRRQMNYII